MSSIQVFSKRTKLVASSLLLLVFSAVLSTQSGVVLAQTKLEAKTVKGGTQNAEPLKIAIIDFAPKGSRYAERVTQVIKDDLTYSLHFNIAEINSSVLATLGNDLRNMSGWQQLGVQYVLEGSAQTAGQNLTVEIRLADVSRGSVIKTSKWEMEAEAYRTLAHAISDEVVLTATGQKGIFSTKIAYVRWEPPDKEIYVCDYDGHNPRPITQDRSINVCPAWSPDGSKLVYTSYKNRNPDLWISDVSTGESKVFASYKGLNSNAAWSPDEKYVVATLSKDGNSEIYLLTPEGQIVRRLTNTGAIDCSPTWSPDGKQIAFASDRPGVPQLYVMDTEGNNLKRLTYTGKISDSPCWSPQGDKIAFAFRQSRKFDICIINAKGENLTQLTHTGSNENPDWSPDGKHIVFASNRTGKYELYTMHWDGSGERKITTGEAISYNPSWSPSIRLPGSDKYRVEAGQVSAFGGTRGDANADGRVDVGDAIHLLNYLFKGGPDPSSGYAADTSSDGVVDLGDVVHLLNYLFKGGSAPAR